MPPTLKINNNYVRKNPYNVTTICLFKINFSLLCGKRHKF